MDIVVKIVDDFEGVIDYICIYGLDYMDCIIIEDDQVVVIFFECVDSVILMYNFLI